MPLFTKASGTDKDIVDAWVFIAQACCSITFQTDAARRESHKPLSLSSAEHLRHASMGKAAP